MIRKRNIYLSIIVSSIIIISLAWLVMATITIGDAVKVELPASGTNHSGIQMSIVNMSFLNGTDASVDMNGTGALFNATFYINVTGTAWQEIGNSTECYTYTGALGKTSFQNISCSGSLNLSKVINGTYRYADGFYSLNATVRNGTVLAGTLQYGVGLLGNLTTIMIDNTEPNIAEFNLIAIANASGQNHSNTNAGGNITFNITAVDALANVSSVIFNIINSTGGVNDTVIGIAEGLAGRYSVSIDTRDYPDGKYNITVFVNDTVGNFNATANNTDGKAELIGVVFDNSAPTGTVSCEPASVTQGSTVTCTCSPTDTHSGINASATSNPTPATGNTGTIQHTCSFTNNAGISSTAVGSYVVEGIGTGTGGSGGTGTAGTSGTTTWSATYSVTSGDFTAGHTRELAEKTRLKVLVENTEHFVGVLDVTSDSAKISVSSTHQEATMKVGETKKFEVTGDNFYDMQVTLESVSGSKAKLTIKAIREEVPAAGTTTGTGTAGAGTTGTTGAGASSWVWIVLVIIVVVVVAVVWYKKRR